MSDLVERQFPTKALMTGLRAIGYSFSSAVADIIENAIKYCEFVYTSLYPKQVKEIIDILNKLKENGIV